MIRTPAIERIVAVARALDGLPEPFLFVGASVLGLLASQSEAPMPRPTEDVDLVALVADYVSLAALHERLRQRGFSEDSESRVICRWRYRGWIVDVMPPDPDILGFSNELYPSALAHAATVELDGVAVRHIDAPHFVGTKLLAFEGRGGGDLWSSHDLEDLVAVVNSRPEIVPEIAATPPECRSVVVPRLSALRRDRDFEDALDGHLANDAPGRVAVVLARIDAILSAR